MIEIIAAIPSPDLSVLYVDFDFNGRPQPILTLSRQQWCDALMDVGYIADFHNDGDVAVQVDGRKYWISFDRWVTDDMSDVVAKDLVEHLMKKASATGGPSIIIL